MRHCHDVHRGGTENELGREGLAAVAAVIEAFDASGLERNDVLIAFVRAVGGVGSCTGNVDLDALRRLLHEEMERDGLGHGAAAGVARAYEKKVHFAGWDGI